MNTENITLGTCVGEALEERMDDNSNCLYLRCLDGIELKQNGKSLMDFHGNKFFPNPPTKEVQLMRELLENLNIELIPCKDFRSSQSVTVKVSEQTQLIQVEAGFWTKWKIVVEGIPYGIIKETGNFWDREADIIIDIQRDSQ